MTTNHIDQLAQWYADAERITDTNLPRIGDTLIFPYNAGGYAIEVEEDDWTLDDVVDGESVHILARAPKPKPAWHDAVAVIAHTEGAYGLRPREVYAHGIDDKWESLSCTARTKDLIDPTPLIEAKATDEMVKRAREEARSLARPVPVWIMRAILAAALGLETE